MAIVKDLMSFLMLILYLSTWNNVFTYGRIVMKKMTTSGVNNNRDFKAESTTTTSEDRQYSVLSDVYSTLSPSSSDESPSTVYVSAPDDDYYKQFQTAAIANVRPNANTGHISQPERYEQGLAGTGVSSEYYDQGGGNHKPIQEPLREIPKQPIPVAMLTKAAVEPIPIFQNSEQRSAFVSSKTESSQTDDTGKYEYEYIVEDDHWGSHFGHREYHNGPQTKGKYQVLLPDGRLQSVQYWSDTDGYHAVVTYESLLKRYRNVRTNVN